MDEETKTYFDLGRFHKFTETMQQRLIENAYKGTWYEEDISFLYTRLSRKMEDMRNELGSTKSSFRVDKHAADIANYAMMIADVVRRKDS